MRLYRLPVLGIILLLAACATVSNQPTVPAATSAPRTQQAQQLFAQGRYVKAAQAYATLATQHPETSDPLWLRAAQAWQASGSPSRAATAVAHVQPGALNAADANAFTLLQTQLALGDGQLDQVLALTGNLPANLSDDQRVQMLRLRARAFTAQRQPWQAARTRVALAPYLSGSDQARNHDHILDLLQALGGTELTTREATLAPTDPMRAWVSAALARAGAPGARPAPVLTQPVGTLLPGATQGEGYQLPTKVALILPLSGPTPLATAADTVRQGFFSAYFQAGANTTSLPPVRVFDGAGTAAGALAAYQQALAWGATQVVGPMTHAGVSAIFARPALPVATLTLNYPTDNTLPPPDATEFALRPETEGIQAARQMIAGGIMQAIVLVSTDGFAQRAAHAFAAQFQAQGGQVLQQVELDPAQVNYSTQIKSLSIPDPDHTAIFISMWPRQARLLVPQLRLARVDVPMLATPHVYGGRDNPVTDGDLDGVQFCDAPWLFNAQPGLVARSVIAQQLPAARGASGRLFAFGMDAWSLVPYLDWLRTHPGSYLPGATGRLTEDDFGHVRRVLIWAKFKNGLATPVTGGLDFGPPWPRPRPVAAASRH